MGKKVSGTSNNSSNNTVQQTKVTKNYAMRHPHVSITIITEHNEINLSYNQEMKDSYVNKKAYASRDLLSFQVKNALEDDAASFSVVLGGDLRWDRILNADDIMIIRVYENTESPTYNNNYNTNIMTGMITEVRRTGTYSDDQFFYTINGRSMVQAFMQYKIGLVQEVETSLSSMGWLWDTNEEYEADASSSTGQGSTPGGTSVTGSNAAHKIFNYFTSRGYSDAAAAAIVGNGDAESGLSMKGQTGVRKGASNWGWGIWQWTPGMPWLDHAKKHYGSKYDTVGAGCEMLLNSLEGHGVESKWSGSLSTFKKITNPFKAAMYFFRHYEDDVNPLTYGGGQYKDHITDSESWYKKLKGTGKSSDDTSSGSSTVTSGNTNATSSEISNEEKDSTGVAFLQNNPATIETEIIKRFLPYMRFSWGVKGYGLSHYLDYSGMSCWDEYEHLQYSGNLTNFDGSLYELQQAILAQDQGCPFEEMFYSFEKSGKSHLIVRRTPFNPEDWLTTPTVYIDSDQVISEDVGRDNDEVYSVFNVNPSSYSFMGISNSGELLSLPQFNQDLVNLYGYSKYEVTDPYLKGGQKSETELNSTSKSKTKSAKEPANKGTHWSYSDINTYLDKIKPLKKLMQQKSKYAAYIANHANNLSGEEAYALVEDYLNNEGKLTSVKFNSTLRADIGGGISCTGSKDINYQDWLKIIKVFDAYPTSYISECKSQFDNTDFEVLNELRLEYDDGNKKLGKSDYKKIIKRYGVQSQSTKDNGQANDLKTFTQMLYNWYCENSNFYAGDITVVGSPTYQIGTILYDGNYLNGTAIEYYIESVEHDFSLTEGYQSTLGVTRGLDNNGKDRFTHLWGQNQDFLGGYMGEAALSELAYSSAPESSSGSSTTDGGMSSGKGLTGDIANKTSAEAAAFAYSVRKGHTPFHEHYEFGGGRNYTSNPLDKKSGNVYLDCSSFVHWCFVKAGVSNPPNVTWGFWSSPKWKKVSKPKAGDVIHLKTPSDHIVFYLGGGSTIGWNCSDSHNPGGGAEVLSLKQWRSYGTVVKGYYRYVG
ncbi:phage tail tip lysozyme [Lactobacillus acetotolerans]|uniref:phage tail tip lysozyme n=1 Tax=Lactobacillus acetotolerans TaxID=1600 RepID=UPI002FD9270E